MASDETISWKTVRVDDINLKGESGDILKSMLQHNLSRRL